MKSIILLLILLSIFGCHKVKDDSSKIRSLSRDTVWARNEFDRDRHERLQLISYGPPPDEKSQYSRTIMETEYDIGVKFSTGCSVDEGIVYYNELMGKEIEKRFGADFFQRIHFKVDSIYKIDKPLIEKVKKMGCFDTLKIFRYSVFNTSNDRIKLVNGYGWYKFNKKYKVTSFFRAEIDFFSTNIVRFDSLKIEDSALPYQ